MAEKRTENFLSVQDKEFRKTMNDILTKMGIMAKDEDFLIESGASDAVVQSFLDYRDKALCEAVAEALQIDTETLLDPERRTQAQQDLLQRTADLYQEKKIKRFLDSDYLKTHRAITQRALAILQK